VKPLDLLLTLAVMLIWGVNFPISKIGVSELPPILMMGIRFSLVALLLCPLRPLPRDKLGAILLVALLLGGLHFPMMFTGLSRIDAAAASILSQAQVPFAALLAALVFKDRLTLRMWIGMAVAFGGVVLVAGEPRFGHDPWPVFLILGAAFVWSLANLVFKRIGEIDPFALSGWSAFFSAPRLFVISWLLEDGQQAAVRQADWRAWGAILYAAVGVTIVSYGMWYPLVRKYPMSLLMPFTLLMPIIGVGSSMLALGEPLTPLMLLGGVLTITGVGIIVLRRPRPRAP
jgi:O-acetylserine/cysteine efflux transporter